MDSTTKIWLLAPALLFVAACGRNDDSARMDDGLRNDLSLASQAQPFPAQQFVSPYEMQPGMPGYGQPMPQGYYGQPMYPQQYPQPYGQPVYGPQPVSYPQAPAPAPRPAPRPTQTVSRAPAQSSGGTIATSSGSNVKRDAVLGATAGAVIGATASRDKWKGGVLGAAGGAVLGAVIGNTIDHNRHRLP